MCLHPANDVGCAHGTRLARDLLVTTGTPQQATVHLGRSLGLRVSSRDRLIAEIKKGFRVATFEHLARQLDLPERELARFVAISERTLIRRRKAGRLNADESDRIARIAEEVNTNTENIGAAGRASRAGWLRRLGMGKLSK